MCHPLEVTKADQDKMEVHVECTNNALGVYKDKVSTAA